VTDYFAVSVSVVRSLPHFSNFLVVFVNTSDVYVVLRGIVTFSLEQAYTRNIHQLMDDGLLLCLLLTPQNNEVWTCLKFIGLSFYPSAGFLKKFFG